MKKTVLVVAFLIAACTQPPRKEEVNTVSNATGDAAFQAIHDAYVREFLRRNPVVNTYLGGAGLDPSLREADGRLRDHSTAALAAEDRWLDSTLKALENVSPYTLSPSRRVDREVALAQVRFLLRQHQTRRYQEKAVDTYTDEPFRAVDWQLQGMAQTGASSYGTAEEWTLLA